MRISNKRKVLSLWIREETAHDNIYYFSEEDIKYFNGKFS